jgi:hypothetical protein
MVRETESWWRENLKGIGSDMEMLILVLAMMRKATRGVKGEAPIS